MGRKGIGLLLAGLAAYGYYKYSKMSAEQKRGLKDRGKKFIDDNLGSLGNLGNVFGKKTTASAQNS